MANAVPVEGPRAPLFFSAVVLAVLQVLPDAEAQTVDVAALERCAREETPELKLACYERLTAERAEPAAAGPPAKPDPRDAPAAPDLPRPPPAAKAPPPPSQAPRTPTKADAEPVPIAEDFGADQVDAAIDESDRPVSATVIRVTRGYQDRLDFHLSNGHVWRQIEPRRFQYPKSEPFGVVITQGMFGDFRLRVGGDGPMVRIRRVK